MKHRETGSLSAYFSLIMTAFVLFMMTLYLAEQVMLAQIRGRQVLDLCASSCLAGYDQELYQKYGFFAIENQQLAQKDLDHFAAVNLNPYQSGEWTLTAKTRITDQEEYERQLSAFMQYRFPLTLAEQYTHLLEELQSVEDLSAVIDGEVTLSEALEDYNQLFSSFITALEGVDDYGGLDTYCAKGLWDEIWTKDGYRHLLETLDENAQSAVSSWREHINVIKSAAEDAGAYWDALLQEGKRIRPTLEQLYAKAELEEQKKEIQAILESLHDGNSEDLRIRDHLIENVEILKTTGTGLDKLLENMESTDGRKKAAKLLEYYTDIHVAYQLKPMTNGRKSWKKIWNELQDYVTDLSVYVDKEARISSEKMQNIPSQGKASGSLLDDLSLTDLSENAGETIRKAGGMILIKAYGIEYACGMFRNLGEVIDQEDNGKSAVSLRGTEKEEGFLEAEAEYIIAGKGSELSNCRTVRLEIIGIRMLSNLYFLATDPQKISEIEAMSAIGGIVAPGVGDLILKGIIMAVWAGVESFSDYERLIDGKKVPLLKTEVDWQTDIKNISEHLAESEIQEDHGTADRGLRYIDYLKILMMLVPLETIEKRTQDLIQLNLEKETGYALCLDGMLTSFSVEGSFYDSGRRYTMRGEYAYK